MELTDYKTDENECCFIRSLEQKHEVYVECHSQESARAACGENQAERFQREICKIFTEQVTTLLLILLDLLLTRNKF